MLRDKMKFMRFIKPNKKFSIGIIVLLVIVIGVLFFGVRKATAPEGTKSANSSSSKKNEPKKNTNESEFNKSQFSLSDPASPWVVVNKQRPLPSNYVPADLTPSGLRTEADSHLKSLLTSAQNNGYPMRIISAYRSYAQQTATYNGYVASDGRAKADTYSARPGHSEHQTGWTADLGNGVCDLEICFGNTPAGKWLATNAHNYGFIIRYPEGKESITGYQYEPWHVRYVGVDLANQIYKSGQTLEQFFGLPPAPNY